MCTYVGFALNHVDTIFPPRCTHRQYVPDVWRTRLNRQSAKANGHDPEAGDLEQGGIPQQRDRRRGEGSSRAGNSGESCCCCTSQFSEKVKISDLKQLLDPFVGKSGNLSDFKKTTGRLKPLTDF